MSGQGDVTVVWLAEGAAGSTSGVRSGPGDGRDDATRAVLEWARARGLRVRTASESTHGALEHGDLRIADRGEKELSEKLGNGRERHQYGKLCRRDHE